MDESYRHFYLYAKNWYKRTDLIEDLKHITARRCGMLLEHISEKDIILVLVNAVEPYVKFDRFMNDLMDKQWLYQEDDMNTHLIRTMLSVLALLDIEDIPFKLGEPNPLVLSLNDKNSL